MTCTTLDFEARSTRRTCGAFSARPRKTQTSRKCLLRTHEEVAGLAREHDRAVRRVDPLIAERDGGLAQPLPRVLADPRRGPASAPLRSSSSSRAPRLLRPTACSGSTPDRPCPIVATNRLTADSSWLTARYLPGLGSPTSHGCEAIGKRQHDQVADATGTPLRSHTNPTA